MVSVFVLFLNTACVYVKVINLDTRKTGKRDISKGDSIKWGKKKSTPKPSGRRTRYE